MQERYLEKSIVEDALAAEKMAFISGPRQVGKTTLAQALLLDKRRNYFTWDDQSFRRAWSSSPTDAVAQRGPGPIVLDELPKDRRWKARLKGLYDLKKSELSIIVTGSARLDTYRRGGDSLMGRYLPYRMHPFTVGERTTPPAPDQILESREVVFPWSALLACGGFPEPALAGSALKAQRWSRLRSERLIFEDVRDLRAIHDLRAMQVLAELLPEKVGSPLSINSMREDVGVAYATLRAWVQTLEALYVCFLVRPYAKRIARAIRGEPKLYLYDIIQLPKGNLGARRENLTALHLLKACHFWTDLGHGDFELRYVRDKSKREVDFLVLRDRVPWMLVECKSGSTQPSANLIFFSGLLKPVWRVQLVDKAGHDEQFPEHGIRVVSYEQFFAGMP